MMHHEVKVECEDMEELQQIRVTFAVNVKKGLLAKQYGEGTVFKRVFKLMEVVSKMGSIRAAILNTDADRIQLCKMIDEAMR